MYLNPIQANDVAFKGFVYKLHCFDNVETRLLERAYRTQVAFGRIGDNCTHVAVGKNVVRSELPNNRRPHPVARQSDFSYREVDSGRLTVSAQLKGMLWKVGPTVPLNPAYWNAVVLYKVNMNRVASVDTRAVLGLKAIQIESLIPPDRHVRSGKPFLQQGEVRTRKGAE